MITLMFSCDGCGLSKHPFQVPARETEDQSVLQWMEKVKMWVGDEHCRVSPNCQSTTMKELMIPTEGAEFIGQQVE